MVKKLFKHEFQAYARTLVPLYFILFAIAASNRIIQIFESDTVVFDILNTSSVVIYVISIILLTVLGLIYAIKRFYGNLFTNQGYLSFTLPVTTSNHIMVKNITAVAFEFFTLISVMISVMIITAGDVFSEVIKALKYLFKLAHGELGNHIYLYALEIIVLVITASVCQYLLFYTCISIGQLFNKNRVIAAVGVYFVYYVIVQILSTAFMVALTIAQDFMAKISALITAHPMASVHIIICALIVFSLVLAGIYYVVTYKILSRKLNLE